VARLKVGKFIRPLEPIEWPDGTEQKVKNITWEQQEVLADLGEGKLTPREAMPLVMPALLPGKTWDEIKTALSAEAMQAIVAYASGNYTEAMGELEEASGNAVAGEPQVSPPPTPSNTSEPESQPVTGAPCGMS
jgi:hypothetical protein